MSMYILMVCMGVQVEDHYSTIVLPFMKNHFVAGFPRETQQQHQLYLWATAVVSAYSFTLGEDKFQAMVIALLCVSMRSTVQGQLDSTTFWT